VQTQGHLRVAFFFAQRLRTLLPAGAEAADGTAAARPSTRCSGPRWPQAASSRTVAAHHSEAWHHRARRRGIEGSTLDVTVFMTAILSRCPPLPIPC
jgi:hypothetical protein